MGIFLESRCGLLRFRFVSLVFAEDVLYALAGYPCIWTGGSNMGKVIDVIGHVIERDNIRETDKNGRKSRVIDLTLEDLENN